MDAGFFSVITCKRAWLESLNTSANERIDVNQILGSSGFGLYLGRVIRFNSWDLFTDPIFLFRKSFQELQNPLAIQTTMVFSLVVMVLYISLNLLIPPSYERTKNVA